MSYKNAQDMETGQVLDVPVVFIHYGNIPDYMKLSLQNATQYNKTVVLITDTDFKQNKVKCFSIKNYLKDIDVFDSVYKHLSTNSEVFEKMCITRWFVLRNFMEEQKIGTCYYADSDVMIYDDLSKVYENYSEYDVVYTMSESQENYRWAASAHCSYWKIDAIGLFCKFILSCYTTEKKALLDEKWAFHLKNNVGGGVCDMTLLYLFTNDLNFYSLSKVKNGITFDNNMWDSTNYYKDEYEMEQVSSEVLVLKKIKWKNGIPYGYNKITGEKVQFAVLHGYSKILDQKKTLYSKIRNKIKSFMQ